MTSATPGSRSAASKARRISSPFLTSKSRDRNPSDRVAVSVSFHSGGVAGLLRLKKPAITAAAGTISLSSSTRLPYKSLTIELSPVRLPPGRARLATRWVPTGSPEAAMTTGIVAVTLLGRERRRRPPGYDQIDVTPSASIGRAIFDD